MKFACQDGFRGGAGVPAATSWGVKAPVLRFCVLFLPSNVTFAFSVIIHQVQAPVKNVDGKNQEPKGTEGKTSSNLDFGSKASARKSDVLHKRP